MDNQRRANGWTSTAHLVRGIPSGALFGVKRLLLARSVAWVFNEWAGSEDRLSPSERSVVFFLKPLPPPSASGLQSRCSGQRTRPG